MHRSSLESFLNNVFKDTIMRGILVRSSSVFYNLVVIFLQRNRLVQGILESINKVLRILQPNRDPYSLLPDTKLVEILPLLGAAEGHQVVQEHEGDVASQVRTGIEAAVVVKGPRGVVALKLDRHQAAVPGFREVGRAGPLVSVVDVLAR